MSENPTVTMNDSHIDLADHATVKTLNAPNARVVKVSRCALLQAINAPNADQVIINDCQFVALGDVNAPKARKVVINPPAE
ncbi:MAG: hypothetical protein K2X32_06905 [Phycisphaerales bacterium]|nr:hypothetical protein [Phycisphaerales bacterium]